MGDLCSIRITMEPIAPSSCEPVFENVKTRDLACEKGINGVGFCVDGWEYMGRFVSIPVPPDDGCVSNRFRQIPY